MNATNPVSPIYYAQQFGPIVKLDYVPRNKQLHPAHRQFATFDEAHAFATQELKDYVEQATFEFNGRLKLADGYRESLSEQARAHTREIIAAHNSGETPTDF